MLSLAAPSFTWVLLVAPQAGHRAPHPPCAFPTQRATFMGVPPSPVPIRWQRGGMAPHRLPSIEGRSCHKKAAELQEKL
jgi:hypothetical protein